MELAKRLYKIAEIIKKADERRYPPETIAKIGELWDKGKGLSPTEIKEKLNLPSNNTIIKILNREFGRESKPRYPPKILPRNNS